MQLPTNILRALLPGRGDPRAGRRRRSRRVVLSCENLEGRVTPAHAGLAHHAVTHLHAAAQHAHHSTATSTSATTATSRATTGSGSSTSSSSDSSGSTSDSSGSTSSTSSSSNSTLSSALQTLHNDIQTIELASDTTVGELTAIRVAFQALSNDGLSPSSQSALRSFENSLVTAYASGTTLAGDATLLSQFEGLYTSSPTTQETTDLTNAYNALAAAVTSSNITSADLTTINADWAAVLAAEGSTSTATYPYFDLLTAQVGQGGGYGGGGC